MRLVICHQKNIYMWETGLDSRFDFSSIYMNKLLNFTARLGGLLLLDAFPKPNSEPYKQSGAFPSFIL